MKFVFFLLLFFACSNLFGQIEDDAVKQTLTKQFSRFIAKGYTVFDTATSDFNTDGLTDMLLVTTNKSEMNDSRKLMILQKNSAGYLISAICDNAILCKECGGIFGDPYAGISFKKNVLNINHYGGSAWRWSSNFTFRFQNKRWELIGIYQDYYWNMDDCNGKGVGYAGQNLKEVNFSTKRMHIIETKDTDCTPKTDKWVPIKAFKKINLDNFNVQDDYLKTIISGTNVPPANNSK
jgi:hypothetical protein